MKNKKERLTKTKEKYTYNVILYAFDWIDLVDHMPDIEIAKGVFTITTSTNSRETVEPSTMNQELGKTKTKTKQNNNNNNNNNGKGQLEIGKDKN